MTNLEDLRKRRPGDPNRVARVRDEMERETRVQRLLDELATSMKASE